ncbi:MAG TPA: cytochrome P460 family protein, partial [Bryobacteraceae bacterium]|nr:cytochrome P460 family protein [Bryobacteraceae bacterium]
MKRCGCAILAVICAGLSEAAGAGPEYTAEGELVRPADYREWVFVSAGLGMTYGPAAAAAGSASPLFDNVFVAPAAYRAFLETGKWPDKTMFVLEIRRSASEGSINRGGHFQSELVAVEVEVKDEARFPEKWAFFGFNGAAQTAKQFPKARCLACHSTNGAVDNTFVQFYPTLIDVAKAKRTFRATGPQPQAR